jgi:hypothetical protein
MISSSIPPFLTRLRSRGVSGVTKLEIARRTCLQVTLQNLNVLLPSVEDKAHYPEVERFLKIFEGLPKRMLAEA